MKLLLFNLENFFLNQLDDQKPPEKVEWIARIIKELTPDILMLCEIGGLESLDIFNHKYLDNQFLPFILPGNSTRGIEIGYLVKKSLPFSFMHLSHKEKAFSRDVSELRFIQNSIPKMIILLVHLKSKWDREGNDPNGFLQRSHEVEMLLEIYKQRQLEYPHSTILIAGDMNGSAQKNNCEREFRSIYQQTDFIDVLDILDTPDESRVTFVHFNKDAKPLHYQLDYIFLSKSLEHKVIKEESGIYLFKAENGSPLRLPENSFERYALPSDHYPLVLTFDFLQ